MKWYVISWWSDNYEEKFVDEYDMYKDALKAHKNDPDSYPPLCDPREFLEEWVTEIDGHIQACKYDPQDRRYWKELKGDVLEKKRELEGEE